MKECIKQTNADIKKLVSGNGVLKFLALMIFIFVAVGLISLGIMQFDMSAPERMLLAVPCTFVLAAIIGYVIILDDNCTSKGKCKE